MIPLALTLTLLLLTLLLIVSLYVTATSPTPSSHEPFVLFNAPFVLFNAPTLRSEYDRQHIRHDKDAGTLTRCPSDWWSSLWNPCHTVTYKSPRSQLNNSNSSVLANHKATTSRILQLNDIPCPRFVYVNRPYTTAQLDALLHEHHVPFPVVVKPVDGTQGYGVHLNVRSVEEIQTVCQRLRKNNPNRKIIVEEQVDGANYRIMVLRGEVFDVLKRRLASVTGDGVHTLKQLIDTRNRKQKQHKRHPTHNVNWTYIREQLEHETGPDTVLPKDTTVNITNIGNFHNGCNVERVPLSSVHPKHLQRFVKVNQVLGLTLSGIDYMGGSLDKAPGTEEDGYVIEVNDGPDLKIHEKALPVDRGVVGRFVDRVMERSGRDTG